jgi:hypothetical protein
MREHSAVRSKVYIISFIFGVVKMASETLRSMAHGAFLTLLIWSVSTEGC